MKTVLGIGLLLVGISAFAALICPIGYSCDYTSDAVFSTGGMAPIITGNQDSTPESIHRTYAPTSYYCLNPAGSEFPGGRVGPVNMWYHPGERTGVPSPRSRQDGCEQIIRLCNAKFPQVCQGDCLAGRAIGHQAASCEGTLLLSPPKSEIHHNLEANP